MKKDNVIELVRSEEFKDQLTEILRQGAQTLVVQSVEAEFSAFLESHSQEKLQDGRKRIVRHGHLPERKVLTGIWSYPRQSPSSARSQRERVLSDKILAFYKLFEHGFSQSQVHESSLPMR